MILEYVTRGAGGQTKQGGDRYVKSYLQKSDTYLSGIRIMWSHLREILRRAERGALQARVFSTWATASETMRGIGILQYSGKSLPSISTFSMLNHLHFQLSAEIN